MYVSSLLLLMVCNWSIEAFKWKIVVDAREKISFGDSLTGILTGLAYGFITPRSVGDYLGRILQLNKQNRIQYIGAIAFNRLLQLLITLAVGIIGIYYLIGFKLLEKEAFIQQSVLVSILSLIVIILFIIYRKKVVLLCSKIDWLHRVISIIAELSGKFVFKLTTLSLIRFLVFLIQYLIVFWFFEITHSIVVFLSATSAMLLLKSIIPSINFLSDLGIRSTAATLVFGTIGVPVTTALAISLIIWMINVLVPTIIGAILSFKVRLFYDHRS